MGRRCTSQLFDRLICCETRSFFGATLKMLQSTLMPRKERREKKFASRKIAARREFEFPRKIPRRSIGAFDSVLRLEGCVYQQKFAVSSLPGAEKSPKTRPGDNWPIPPCCDLSNARKVCLSHVPLNFHRKVRLSLHFFCLVD